MFWNPSLSVKQLWIEQIRSRDLQNLDLRNFESPSSLKVIFHKTVFKKVIWLSISRDLIASYLRKCATRDSFATHAIAPSVHIVFVDMSLNVIILSSTLITTEQKVKFPWKYFFSKYKKSAVYLSRKCSCLCCVVYRKNYLFECYQKYNFSNFK